MDSRKFIPDVFVIGAMKAATSTLFSDYLVGPDIERTRSKEVNILLQDLPLAEIEKLYSQQFKNHERLKCDVSPKYSQAHNHASVPERMFKANPRAKIIYITRDPIDRIVSHLHHNLLRNRFSEERVNEEVIRDPDYLLCSMYQFQIEQYLSYFQKENILVLTLEEMKADLGSFSRRLSSFLGVATITASGRGYNVSEQRYRIVGHDWVHQQTKNRQLLKLYHYIWYFIGLKVPKPRLSEEVISTLKSKLQEDTRAFARAFDLDISRWKNA
jgi:hypothetical protein